MLRSIRKLPTLPITSTYFVKKKNFQIHCVNIQDNCDFTVILHTKELNEDLPVKIIPRPTVYLVSIMVTPLRQNRGQLTDTYKIKFQTPAYTELFTSRPSAEIVCSKELCIQI